MLIRIYRLVAQKHQFIFISLIIIYFILGIYLIQTNSLTSDEPAYLGTAYTYTQGLGLNQEHPLLLKMINAGLVKIFFPEINVAVPDINTLDDVGIRLAPYNVCYSFLMSNPEIFYRVIFVSRFAYLTFNSILLIWLYFYTFFFKAIDPKISTSLAILYVFSPSFYSHNFLATFDVSASIYALLTVLSLTILVFNVLNFTKNQLIGQFLLTTILLFFALNVKFSNLILLPIVMIAYLGVIVYLFKISRLKLALRFTLLSCMSLLVQPMLIIVMYRIAFGNLPNQSLLDNFNRYVQGAKMTLDAKGAVQEPFLFGKFVPINYIEYIQQIFGFKENPGLFLLMIFIIFILIKMAIRYRYNLIFQVNKIRPKHFLPSFLLIAIVSAYPIIYIYLARDSTFVIGYRHFYPVIIFMYLFVSAFTVLLKSKTKNFAWGICLIIYIFWGLMGIPQSLSYVNPLWTKEKWLLTNDSTLNWGQETQHPVEYLLDNKLLPKKNNNAIIFASFGVVINIPEYLSILSKDKNYPLDMSTYYGDRFNPEEMEIQKLPYKYLLIDSSIKQAILDKADTNNIAAKNWTFLQKNNPIYSHNGVIWIYQLN